MSVELARRALWYISSTSVMLIALERSNNKIQLLKISLVSYCAVYGLTNEQFWSKCQQWRFLENSFNKQIFWILDSRKIRWPIIKACSCVALIKQRILSKHSYKKTAIKLFPFIIFENLNSNLSISNVFWVFPSAEWRAERITLTFWEIYLFALRVRYHFHVCMPNMKLEPAVGWLRIA